MTITAGIDVGSSSIKLVVMENLSVVKREVIPATFRPFYTARDLLALVPEGSPVFATGFGRDLLNTGCGMPTITEIKAHALGARFMFPNCGTVIDIGGQDLKIINLDTKGKVARFEMNDRCAAGTGKFLEVMAQRLGYTLSDFSKAAEAGKDSVTISAMCTVFAESEMVGLINRGFSREDISRALHRSVVKRIAAMYKRLDSENSFTVVTGGGARNSALLALLGETLCATIHHSGDSQFAGALGCALSAIPSVII
jgi:(R)-2-hydroxyacyl-CoA dehydratese activating ATPase